MAKEKFFKINLDKLLEQIPMVNQLESLIKTVKGTIVSLKKEVDTLKETEEENDA